eukprot:TRINITY_DN5553_c0_g3_i1.p1 TRINITY_DN5553_c0_g3~~TRINITY_DN5553_c0_g3_i1.p1  ORF type:complete len:276 (-),score=91.87 TRINITY_DN5553_c0_g3_i1:40-867(-)
MAFTNLQSSEGLAKLNTHLSTRSFVGGWTVSADDFAPFDEVGKATHAQVTVFPHVTRWYNQIKSYSAEERKSIGGGAAPAAAAAAPAAKEAPKKVAAPAPAPAPAAKPAAKPAADDDDDDFAAVAAAAAASIKEEEEEVKPAKAAKADDDDDIDLFGSDDDDDADAKEALDAKKKEAQERAAKKAAEGKSTIILDVKPWDDTTDMVELEKNVRSIQMEGLVWGWSKLVPVGYGIKKLQINCVVQDVLVSVDDLDEKICSFEDHVQSMDIVAFNKI